MEIGVAKGKKLYDKRDDIAKKDQKREAQRNLRSETYSVAAKGKKNCGVLGKELL